MTGEACVPCSGHQPTGTRPPRSCRAQTQFSPGPAYVTPCPITPPHRTLRGRAPQAARPRSEPLDHPRLAEHRQRGRTRRGQPAHRSPGLPRRQGGQRIGVIIAGPAGQPVLPLRIVGQDQVLVIEPEPGCTVPGPPCTTSEAAGMATSTSILSRASSQGLPRPRLRVRRRRHTAQGDVLQRHLRTPMAQPVSHSQAAAASTPRIHNRICQRTAVGAGRHRWHRPNVTT